MATDDSADRDSQSDDEEVTRYRITSIDGIEPGDRFLVTIEGQEIAIFRGKKQFYAVGNHCHHQGGPMCEGRMLNPIGSTKEDDEWQLSQESDVPTVACPWHGWEYELETGKHVAPTDYRLPSYEVIVHEGELYIEM